MIEGLRAAIWSRFNRASVFLLLAAFAAISIVVFVAVEAKAFFTPTTGWLILFSITVIVIAFVNPLLQTLRTGFAGVKEVCATSAALVSLVAASIYIIYFCFYYVVPSASSSASSAGNALEKILNLPPVLVAVWAAIIGWYVSFQASAKNQRTANAFSLSMQTRTSKELVDAGALVRTHFPPDRPMAATDEHMFRLDYAGLQAQALQDAENEEPKDANKIKELRHHVAKANAVNAMKHLLNYYEFMAVGISAGDLDENLLYETLAVQVCSQFERAGAYVSFLRDHKKGEQPLALEHVEKLVNRWSGKLKVDEANRVAGK